MKAERHHPFSPSKLERLELCPGSFAIEGPEEEVSELAEEGVQLHALVPPLAAAAEGDMVTAGGTDMVMKARAFLHALAERHAGLYGWTYERKMRFIDRFEILSEGTADVVGETPDAVIVVDWKFGHKEATPAEHNLQLLTYAAMAMQATTKPRAHLHVYHPRLDRESYHLLDMQGLAAVRDRIVALRAAALAESVQLNPSAKACEYCQAKAACPALRRTALALANVHSSQIIDPAAMGKLLLLAKMASKWADSVEYHAKNMALRGQTPHGYKLQARKGRRILSDPQKTFNALAAYFSTPEFMAFCTIDVGKLEGAFVAKNPGNAAAARRQLESLLLGVMARSEDSISLVAE